MFLIAAIPISPVFFLGPLGLLLLLSRPGTLREWLWIVLCTGALIAWFGLPASLTQQTVDASAVFYVGAFVALTLAGVRSLGSRAIAAVALSALATAGWYVALHLRFVDLQNEIVTQVWNGYRDSHLWTDLPPALPPTGDIFAPDAVPSHARQLAWIATSIGTLYPAWLALVALLGTWLAWDRYHRIARTPMGEPARPFRQFRFNDHLIWLALLLMASALVPVSHGLTLATWNILLVVTVLYAIRGMAIARTVLQRFSPLFIGLLLLMMLPLFTVVPIGFAVLGIADTWLDFRRRIAPPSGVPS